MKLLRPVDDSEQLSAIAAAPIVTGSRATFRETDLLTMTLECSITCEANQLPRPLAGLIFHYDTFISDEGGLPCEAAWLSSNLQLKVRVLCPPTNITNMKRIYRELPNVSVHELRLCDSDLNTRRMMDLMAVSPGQNGQIPLYLHVVQRVLRDLRIRQQQVGGTFDYNGFKTTLHNEALTSSQCGPLQQRLDTLESFMVKRVPSVSIGGAENGGGERNKSVALSHHASAASEAQEGTKWTPVSGQLTIVDLSCPCITPEMACSLFTICLSLFLEQDTELGRVIALDEAHKYMTDNNEGQAFTESLLSTIRLQRHLGVRVIISTQEPTISPRLLDLSTITIIHRFTSPD
ncbi:C2H2-type domain-containing protein [Fusarium sp. Ph1]|nr:C2H2-type domain-containing protein [Fusarium sp. Ph1]